MFGFRDPERLQSSASLAPRRRSSVQGFLLRSQVSSSLGCGGGEQLAKCTCKRSKVSSSPPPLFLSPRRRSGRRAAVSSQQKIQQETIQQVTILRVHDLSVRDTSRHHPQAPHVHITTRLFPISFLDLNIINDITRLTRSSTTLLY